MQWGVAARAGALMASLAALACAGEGEGGGETEGSTTAPMKSSASATTGASATTSTGGASTSTTGAEEVACGDAEAGVGDVGYELLITPQPAAGGYHLDLPCTISGTMGTGVFDGIGLVCDDAGVETIVSLFVSNGQLRLPAVELGAEVRLEVVRVEAESVGVAIALHDAAEALIVGVNAGPFVPPAVDDVVGGDVLTDFWAPFTVAPALTDCDDEPGDCAPLRRRAALRFTHTPSAGEALVLDHQVTTIAGYGIHVGAAYVDVGDAAACDGGVSTELSFAIVRDPA
ncbi:MAG: hypothetical protein R3A79_21070 [Nannocystaceae bacterium]